VGGLELATIRSKCILSSICLEHRQMLETSHETLSVKNDHAAREQEDASP
jgi:hypothetical protein